MWRYKDRRSLRQRRQIVFNGTPGSTGTIELVGRLVGSLEAQLDVHPPARPIDDQSCCEGQHGYLNTLMSALRPFSVQYVQRCATDQQTSDRRSALHVYCSVVHAGFSWGQGEGAVLFVVTNLFQNTAMTLETHTPIGHVVMTLHGRVGIAEQINEAKSMSEGVEVAFVPRISWVLAQVV